MSRCGYVLNVLTRFYRLSNHLLLLKLWTLPVMTTTTVSPLFRAKHLKKLLRPPWTNLLLVGYVFGLIFYFFLGFAKILPEARRTAAIIRDVHIWSKFHWAKGKIMWDGIFHSLFLLYIHTLSWLILMDFCEQIVFKFPSNIESKGVAKGYSIAQLEEIVEENRRRYGLKVRLNIF